MHLEHTTAAQQPVACDMCTHATQHALLLLLVWCVLQACIMVFDVTRKLTYKNLDTWYEELQHHAPGIPTLVVANKIDIDYQVGGQCCYNLVLMLDHQSEGGCRMADAYLMLCS
jgi:hypothetical protein